jgi:hypothetical protein
MWKFKLTRFSSVIVYFLLLVTSKHSSKNFVLIQFSSTILLQWKKVTIHLQQKKKTYKIVLLFVLNVLFSDSRREGKGKCTEQKQAFPSFNLLKSSVNAICVFWFRSRIFGPRHFLDIFINQLTLWLYWESCDETRKYCLLFCAFTSKVSFLYPHLK